MLTHPLVRAASGAALVVLAACGDSPAGPRSEVSDMDLLGVVLASSAGANATGTTSCPAGGQMIRGGTMEAFVQGDVATLKFDTSTEFRSCRHVFEERSITVDGESRMTGQIRTRIQPNGQRDILDAAYRQVGTHRWSGDGIDRTCDVDLTTTYDPAARRYSVVGRICGRDVRMTIPG